MSGYPQMPPLTQEELSTFLSQPLIAKLSTHNEDGSIHTVPIWFKYDSGSIIMGTQEITRKVRNIRSNPNVTVMIDNTTPALQAVIFYGKASLEYDDVLDKRISIFERYIPPEQATGFAQSLANKWQSVVIRVDPEQIISFDYAKGSLI